MKIALLLVLISCGHQQKQGEILSSIPIDSNEGVQVKIDNTVSYTPDLVKETDVIKEKKKPKVGIVLYPSIYFTQASIELFKEFEKKSIKIDSLSSFGYGSVLCALYAKEGSASYLEWKMFALNKLLINKRPYSKEWKATVISFLKKEFKSDKIKKLKVKLLIPNLKDGEIIYDREVLIVDAVKESLELENHGNFFNSKFVYFNLDNFLETNLTFNIAFLPEQIRFKYLNGLDYGIYTKYLGNLLKEKEKINLIQSKNHNEIDVMASSTDIIKLYQDNLSTFSEKIKNQYDEWKEDNSSSFININN